MNTDLTNVTNKKLKFDDFLFKLQTKFKIKDQRQREKEIYERSKKESPVLFCKTEKSKDRGDPLFDSE